MRRAMEVLRERGLIETIHGRGTFVRKDQGRSLPSRCGDRRYWGCSNLIMPNTCRNRQAALRPSALAQVSYRKGLLVAWTHNPPFSVNEGRARRLIWRPVRHVA